MFAYLYCVTQFRVTQWREMISESTQKIGRPRQLYTGPTLRQVPPLRQRRPSYDISLLGSTKSESKLCSPLSTTSNRGLIEFDFDEEGEGEGDEGGGGAGEHRVDQCSIPTVVTASSAYKAVFHRPN